MNWGIYKKRKRLILWAFIINLIVVLPIILFLSLGKLTEQSRRLSKDNVRLKQIANTVAMYFSDGKLKKYPQYPKCLDLDGCLINDAVQDTWTKLSNTSPYFFYENEYNWFYLSNAWQSVFCLQSLDV